MGWSTRSAYAPPSCLGGDFLDAPWTDVATAVQVSAYLPQVADGRHAAAVRELGWVVRRTDVRCDRWPGPPMTGWALRRPASSPTARYLARELGPRKIRVNLVAAGPVRTMAAKSIPGFATFEDAWDGRAPLGWDNSNAEPVARGCRRTALGLAACDNGRDRARRRRLPRDGRLIGRLRRAVAAVLRRPGGPGRGPAVPAQRDARPRASPTSGWPRWRSTTSTSAASRPSTSRTVRCSPRSGRTSPLVASTWACTGVIATGTRTSTTRCGRWSRMASSARSSSTTSATSSYSGCRQYRENLADAQAELGPSAPLLHKLRHYFDHPGFVAANADRVRAALTDLPSDRREAARLVFTAHSHPGGDERLVRTLGRALPRRASRDGAPGRRGGAWPTRRVRSGLAIPLRPVSCAVAATRYQRSPANAGR